jgi:transcriptional regulator
LRKKRYRGTFLTEEEVRILDLLLKYDNVSEVARMLGKAQPTVSIAKKRIEEKLNMSLETVKLALSKGLISKDELMKLISTVETYRRLEREEK